MKVFLGGTCNESPWREALIPLLKIDYFNPVVSDWTQEAQLEELKQRETCDFVLYVLTPAMSGVYSIAELIDDSNKRPEKTVFAVLTRDVHEEKYIKFSPEVKKSLKAVADLAIKNGSTYCYGLDEVANFLNNQG